jgi:acyl-phosphate glycerol 3-phosphate acyltransferase
MESFLAIFQYHLVTLLVILSVSYLIGGINFSILATKKLYGQNDIRNMGSGNAGFTNVLRSAGKAPAIMTFIGDFAKGVLAIWISKNIASLDFSLRADNEAMMYIMLLAGLYCVIGHIYPCFFGFRGGKGILTGWAVTLLIDWRIFFTVISVFLILLLFVKIVSVASIAAAGTYPLATFAFYYMDFKKYDGNIFYVWICTVVALITGLLVILKHKSNIIRLLSGTENKISLKR